MYYCGRNCPKSITQSTQAMTNNKVIIDALKEAIYVISEKGGMNKVKKILEAALASCAEQATPVAPVEFIAEAEEARRDVGNKLYTDGWWINAPAIVRVTIEDILILYDQMLDRLRPSENTVGHVASNSAAQPTIEQLRDELDDKRVLRFSNLTEEIWHLVRKHSAEHLLDKYDIYPKGEAGKLPEQQPADTYIDLSEIDKSEKDKLIRGFGEVTAKEALRLFLSLGLQTHIEVSVVNEPTNELYLLSFRKIDPATGTAQTEVPGEQTSKVKELETKVANLGACLVLCYELINRDLYPELMESIGKYLETYRIPHRPREQKGGQA